MAISGRELTRFPAASLKTAGQIAGFDAAIRIVPAVPEDASRSWTMGAAPTPCGR